METVEAPPIELSLNATHPVSGKLIVATNLTAANEGTVCFRAVNCGSRTDANLIDTVLILLGPAAAKVATDVTAGPIVNHRRRRRLVDRRLDGHVGGRSGS